MKTQLRAALVVHAALLVGGCLLVTPLDDLPSSSTVPSQGGSGGKGMGGSDPVGGAAGDAGEPPVGGTGGTGGTLPNGMCETNAECIQASADEPARCRPSDHQCVTLRNEACPVVIGDAADPNAIYFGAFASLDRVTPEENSVVWAHQLALQELSGDSNGGLPNGPQGKRRPLVMVVCNNLDELAEPAMEHLADEVQVPAVIATLKPGDLRRAYEAHGDRDIFYLSPVPVTKSIAGGDDEGRIWALLGQPSDFAPTYAALVTRAEAWLRSTRKLEEAPIKVALVATTDAFDSELRDAVTLAVRFNGNQTATQNEAAAQFLSITLDPSAPDLANKAVTIAEFAPDLVISTAGALFLQNNGLQDRLEGEWGVLAAPKARPFYILSPYDAGNVNALRDRISGVIGNDPNGGEDNQRFVGVTIAPAPDISLQRAYEVRLRSSFEDAILDTANYYDATYFLAYAMYSAKEPNGLTGAGIAAGMQNVLAGKDSFDIGPAAISDVYEALEPAGAMVHVNSTLGPPEFDAATGVRAVDGGVFCFTRSGQSARIVHDVARYDRQLKTLVGDFESCNPSF